MVACAIGVPHAAMLALDLAIFDGGAARRFLAVRGHLLRDDERDLLGEWLAEPVDMYEVSSVRRGTELTLRSLVGGPQRIGQRSPGGQAKTRLARGCTVPPGLAWERISRSAGSAGDYLTVPAGAADRLEVEALADVRAVRDDHRGTPDLGDRRDTEAGARLNPDGAALKSPGGRANW